MVNHDYNSTAVQKKGYLDGCPIEHTNEAVYYMLLIYWTRDKSITHPMGGQTLTSCHPENGYHHWTYFMHKILWYAYFLNINIQKIWYIYIIIHKHAQHCTAHSPPVYTKVVKMIFSNSQNGCWFMVSSCPTQCLFAPTSTNQQLLLNTVGPLLKWHDSVHGSSSFLLATHAGMFRLKSEKPRLWRENQQHPTIELSWLGSL